MVVHSTDGDYPLFGLVLLQAYWFALNLMPPVMNDTMIRGLQLVNFSRLHVDDNEQLVPCLEQLFVDREFAIICLVEQLYGRYLFAVQVCSLGHNLITSATTLLA
jgi:hypothetical protein